MLRVAAAIATRRLLLLSWDDEFRVNREMRTWTYNGALASALHVRYGKMFQVFEERERFDDTQSTRKCRMSFTRQGVAHSRDMTASALVHGSTVVQ